MTKRGSTVGLARDPRERVVLAAEDDVVAARLAARVGRTAEGDAQVGRRGRLEHDAPHAAAQRHGLVRDGRRVRHERAFC